MDLAIARAVNILGSDERVCVEAIGQELAIWMRILRSAVDHEENTPVPVEIDSPATEAFLKAEGDRWVVEVVPG